MRRTSPLSFFLNTKKGVAQFLKIVALGDIDQVKNIVADDQHMLLESSHVSTISGDEFYNITPIQLSAYYMNIPMCFALLHPLYRNQQRDQLDYLFNHGISCRSLTTCSSSFSKHYNFLFVPSMLLGLIIALKSKFRPDLIEERWNDFFSIQQTLPPNAAMWYCNPHLPPSLENLCLKIAGKNYNWYERQCFYNKTRLALSGSIVVGAAEKTPACIIKLTDYLKMSPEEQNNHIDQLDQDFFSLQARAKALITEYDGFKQTFMDTPGDSSTLSSYCK